MADGWIKIHRSIQQNWIWKDPIKFSWWMDILLNVNYSDSKVNIGLELYDCKRGQSIMSLQNWAERWKVSKDTARNFLKLLEKDGMILHEGLGKTTRITVCKYDDYQCDLHESKPKSTRKTNARSPIKEREERKEEEVLSKEKEIHTPTPFEKFNIWLKENRPSVSQLKTQLTEDQMNYLISEYGKDRFFDVLARMENKVDLLKKYKSVYLTAKNWLE